MNEYISIKKHGLPDRSMLCLVSNSNGWMRNIKAVYIEKQQVFRLDDLNYRETLLLDVTHYYPLPGDPEDE